MPDPVTYSAVSDLLTGDIPTPAYLSPPKYVADATDEIDSKVGFIYQTPLDLTDASPMARPARLLIKRIANFLASGRLLLAVTTPSEDTTVHAYGASLIKEANAALNAIASGEIRLEGATLAEGASLAVSGPLIYNVDPESNVEAFYSRAINNPNQFALAEPYPRV